MNSCRCLSIGRLSFSLFFYTFFCGYFRISVIFLFSSDFFWTFFLVIFQYFFLWFFVRLTILHRPMGINFFHFVIAPNFLAHKLFFSPKRGYCTKALEAFNCTKRRVESKWRRVSVKFTALRSFFCSLPSSTCGIFELDLYKCIVV